jgi:hypothetical protein
VLEGRLEVRIGFEEHVLEPGDSISFDSTIPHRLANVGDVPVRAIWFVLGRIPGGVSSTADDLHSPRASARWPARPTRPGAGRSPTPRGSVKVRDAYSVPSSAAISRAYSLIAGQSRKSPSGARTTLVMTFSPKLSVLRSILPGARGDGAA